ncbi:MAG TPA: choice-of-anchor D domain-containing protein [Kofleriaceae bacterium]|nr:choice-of-anchor D domain-containing protein [Kofleriaceae bacterium]
MNLRPLSCAVPLLLLAAACGSVEEGGGDGDPGDSDHRTDGGAGDPGGDGGPAGASRLEVDREAVDFGNVVRGQTSAGARFTVRNAGDAASGELTTALSGDIEQFELVSDDCGGEPLAAGATCTIEARFAPAAAGPWTAAVLVSAEPGGELEIGLVGRGLQPGALIIDVDSRNFGRVNIADTSGVTTFEITNTGEAATGQLAVELSNAASFRLVADECSGQALAGQGTCTVGVRFAPAAVGSANGSLTVGASPGGEVAASLGGTGTATVTVARTGTGGGSISSSPAGIDDCAATSCTGEFDTPSVSLSASAASSSQFMGWGAPCGGTGACSLDLDDNVALAATFEALRTLTLETSGSGSVSATGCASSSCSYPHGTSVTLTASPGTNYRFGTWTGCASTSTTCVVSMTQDRTVRANFETQRLNLTIARGQLGGGPGVSVRLSTGQTCSNYVTCGYNWANPTTVTLTRQIDPGDGECTRWIGWTGGGCTFDSTSCTVTVSGTVNVTATFDRIDDCNPN